MSSPNYLPRKRLFWFSVSLLASLLAFLLLGAISFAPGVSLASYLEIFALLFGSSFVILIALSLTVVFIRRRFQKMPPEHI